MIPDKHYNAAIYAQLRSLTADGVEVEPLRAYLDGLSNSSFRTAGYVLSERVMQECDANVFWALACALVDYNSRAFLVTVLKAFLARRSSGIVGWSDEGFRRFATLVAKGDIDRKKTLQTLLPHIDVPEDAKHLFRSVGLRDQADWLPYLLNCNTLPSYYLLLSSLRHVEHRPEYVRRVIVFLVKKGDSLSFNFASLLCAYFGVDDIKSTFSLILKPYELSRIELSYDAFCQKMRF